MVCLCFFVSVVCNADVVIPNGINNVLNIHSSPFDMGGQITLYLSSTLILLDCTNHTRVGRANSMDWLSGNGGMGGWDCKIIFSMAG